jgi:hypothetical protein
MIWVIAACAQAVDDEPWFLHYPLTVTPEGVGGVLHVRVTDAAGDYWVSLSDPSGTTRRSENVNPAYGVYFTYSANQAGTWTVSVGKPFATGVSADVDFTLAPRGVNNLGGGSCGLLGLDALLVLFAFRSWRRRTGQVGSL